MQALGKLWGSSGKLWGALGKLWEALGSSGELWGALGKLWEALGSSGKLWGARQANRTRVAKVDPHKVREGCQIQIANVKTARGFRHQTCRLPVRVAQAEMAMCKMLKLFRLAHAQSTVRVNNSKTQVCKRLGRDTHWKEPTCRIHVRVDSNHISQKCNYANGVDETKKTQTQRQTFS